jgi:hypothetical protein
MKIRCCTCGEEKEASSEFFHKNSYSPSGFHYKCKLCKQAYDREYLIKNKDSIHAKAKIWRKNNSQYRRYKRLVESYGCNQATYDKFFKEQNGVCAICGREETRIARGSLCKLAVDHDHETGIIRGLLCYHCNLALGHFNDSLDLLDKAVNYLEGNLR